MTQTQKLKLLADYNSFVGTIDERFDSLSNGQLEALRAKLNELYLLTDRRADERRK